VSIQLQEFRTSHQNLSAKTEAVERQAGLLGSAMALFNRYGPTESTVLISVILPTYNKTHCIAEAIQSVLAQYYQNWELIIVDDGSVDSTASVVAPYLRDSRVHYLPRAHGGQSRARNHGIARSQGEIIAYLDSDNVWYPGFLHAAAAAFSEDAELEVVYGAMLSEHHEIKVGTILWERFDRRRLCFNNFIDLNPVAHWRKLVRRYGGFDERLARLPDWDLILRYTVDTPARPIPVFAALPGARQYPGDGHRSLWSSLFRYPPPLASQPDIPPAAGALCRLALSAIERDLHRNRDPQPEAARYSGESLASDTRPIAISDQRPDA